VTVCTRNRECIFGNVVDGSMVLNDAGRMVQSAWDALPTHFQHVELDQFVIMPNHIHGIIVLTDGSVGAGLPRPYKKRTLGQMVAYLKYRSTKQINQHRDSPGVPLWQRNFYERIIRDEAELNRIREYIRNNPLNWDSDEENPER
jgi:putative transposase